MDPRRPSWMDETHQMAVEVPTLDNDVLTPPSTYVLGDGNDWNTQVGSLFGEQLQPVFTTEDQVCGDGSNDIFDHDLQITLSNTGSNINDQHSRITGDSWQDAFNRRENESSSNITLQDLIKSEEVDAVYPYIEDPWKTNVDGVDTMSLPSSHAQLSAGNSPWSEHQAQFSNYARSNTDGLTDGGECNEPCYARLLFKCLKDAPDHILSLKQIYCWIKENTQRARDPGNKGWQNSVRHNLSMNAAFERVTTTGNVQTKKGSLWRLTNDAIHRGVISTTRYRRDPKRKAARRGAPALKRQMSGAKGGAATRAASHARRAREFQNRSYMMHGDHRFYTTPPESTAVTPVHMHSARFQHPQMAPASPYFGNVAESWQAQSSPHSAQPQASYCFPQVQCEVRQDFEFGSLGPSQQLFHDVDEECYTPSLITDNSVYTDDGSKMHTSQAHADMFG